MTDRDFDNDMMRASVEELGLKGALEELVIVCARMAEYAAEAENEAASRAWASDEATLQQPHRDLAQEEPKRSGTSRGRGPGVA